MKKISTIIIIMGLLIAAYPKASELYADYQQKKLIDQWQQSLSIIDIGEIAEVESEQIQNHEQEENLPESINENEENEEENKKRIAEKRAKDREAYIKKHMEGMLKIDKIKFSQPILKGATENNLKISVASVANLGEPGEVGNYAIAGHRSRGFGRNFNRLEEVEVDDIVSVDTGESQYEYTVTEILYVKPEEVWVLNNNKKDREITLITCHPMVNPTHRLIIKGMILD